MRARTLVEPEVSNIETSLAGPNFGATGRPQVARKQQSFTRLRLPRGTPALYCSVLQGSSYTTWCHGQTCLVGLKSPAPPAVLDFGALIGKTQGKMQSSRLNFMHRWILFDFAIANASNTRASSLGPFHWQHQSRHR